MTDTKHTAAQPLDLDKQFEAAINAAYPIPDTPHTSVMQRANEGRGAFTKGWQAALIAQARAARLDTTASASGELIAAAEKNAEAYDGDDREGIKTDVINAFYQGAAWQARATLPPVAAQQAASEKLPIELRGIAEEVAEGSGFWHSCSGCHESNEGCPTGPHSAVFGCALGNGCSECGGIGAVWDNTDYEAMVAEMHDNISAGAATTSQDAPAEREYEIWADGYCESGTEGRKTEPYLWGKQVGTDFLDACRNFARRDASFARYLHISDGVATAYTTLYPYNPARRATQQEGGK